MEIQNTIQFRYAKETEVKTILNFIKELAVYEKMLNEVVATESLLQEWIFEKKLAQVIFGEYKGNIIGFALYFYNFSTFVGRSGLYLEDLYVKPEYRKKGFGKAFFQKLASIAVENGCGRMEWACLDWNQPSIDFYMSMGARPMDEWTVYRLAGNTLSALAGKDV